MATWLNLSFQDSASPLMEQLIFFYDHTIMIVIVITVMISYMLTMLFFNSYTNRYLMHGEIIEIIWTILPTFILMFIAMPSLRLLYLMEETNSPAMTMKTSGNQWYWKYEYSDYSLSFDSYMLPASDLSDFRLLDVDSRMILPMNTQIRMLVTATDVLHSWTIPALGVKIDAVPGRLNQTSFFINRPGLFFGQCSEICGANHSFMPIVVESIPTYDFIKWILLQTKNLS